MSKYGSNTNRPLSEIVGLSTDTKPTDSIEGIKIQNGSSFRELDTGKKFLFDAENTTWNEVSSGGGGGGSILIEKSITANGVYNASDDSADGYSKVTVDVPNSYTAEDEGKVVDNGALVAQTTHAEITENGIYDITTNNSVSVNVSAVSENNAKFGVHMNTKYFSMGNVESIVIPEGCYGISTAVFRNCNWLSSVTLPSTLESIASEAFKGCSSLISIEIPSSVTSILYNSFESCSALLTITVHKPEGSISGAPWGATNATVIWDG